MSEIKILKLLDHPNIARFHEFIEDSKKIYIVMEFVSGVSLATYLASNRLSDKSAKNIFKQILMAIEHCHRHSVTHRDIKLDNILLTEDEIIKIIDFGFSTHTPENMVSRIHCGTPSYVAPEIILKKEYFGPKADVWALGVVLFAMLTADFPFKASNERDLNAKIVKGLF